MHSALLPIVCLIPLAGCGLAAPVAAPVAAPAGAAVAVASIPILHRTPIDVVVSVVTGRDCSIVHLDRSEAYCRPKEKPPDTPLFCTRSLGVPDCWADPGKLPGNPPGIADGPKALTAEQEADRKKWGPGLW